MPWYSRYLAPEAIVYTVSSAPGSIAIVGNGRIVMLPDANCVVGSELEQSFGNDSEDTNLTDTDLKSLFMYVYD